MDYSKWKKIALILMIITFLLNIFTKVFGAFQFEYDGSIYNVGDGIATKPYFFLYVCKPITSNGSWYYYYLVSDNEFTYSPNGGFQGHQAFHFNTTSNYYSIITSSPTTQPNPKVNYFNISTLNMTYTTSGFLTQYLNIDKTNGFLYTNFDIKYYNSNEIFNENNDITYPYFSNTSTEISNLSFDKLYVEPADYGTVNPLYLHTLQITQTITDDSNIIYYYTDNIIRLDNTSPYYTQFADSDYYYYGVPRRKLGFQVNSTYLLLLSNSSDIITNSVGPIVEDDSNGVYEAVSINTENIYTYQQSIDDNIQNIQDDISNTNTNITNNDITNTFDYNTDNEQLSNNHNGFFSRFLNLFTNLYQYDLSSDSPIEIPLPHSDKKIVLHSNIISSHIGEPLKSIISAFWMYIFYLYAWKFLNHIYIEIQTGKILDDESSNVPGAIHTDIL